MSRNDLSSKAFSVVEDYLKTEMTQKQIREKHEISQRSLQNVLDRKTAKEVDLGDMESKLKEKREKSKVSYRMRESKEKSLRHKEEILLHVKDGGAFQSKCKELHINSEKFKRHVPEVVQLLTKGPNRKNRAIK